MKNKAMRFLKISLILLLLLGMAIFSCLTVFLNRESAATIREVSRMYMASTSEQIVMHFDTTIGLRLDQLDVLARTIVSDSIHEDREEMETLIFNARARELACLAFCEYDGTFNTIYGAPMSLDAPEPFIDSLRVGEKKVAVGNDADGNRIIILGVPAAHEPTENYPCIGLVAGLPASYISETLALDENDEHVYSYIIREDSSFVIRTNDAFRQTYFDRVRSFYDSVNGEDVEHYIAGLARAMANQEDYTAEVMVQGEARQMYCTKLGHSEWFLITFMPYSALDAIVSGFTGRWTAMVVGAFAIILGCLLFIFARTFHVLERSRKTEEAARLAAEEARVSAEEARHKAERAEQKARDASKAKSEFLSNMSHDIRTPMNAIVGMTAIATANIDNREQVQNCLRKITLSSKHLLGLINDVLDMAKIESGKMTLNMDQVSLREVMESIVSIVQPQVRAKKQQFDVSIHDITTENVCCDSVRLNQVLLNLVSNAIKFTPDGGAIRIALYEEKSPRGGDYVRIHLQVKDNGIGMSEEFQRQVFESFAREDSKRVHKTEGTGLGMAITKYIVDAMGGAITVDSEQGRGTEFNVTLDLEKGVAQESEMTLPRWNMLVVDDDEQLCVSTADSLKAIGVNADWCLDGESAVRMATERHLLHDSYHIILLDWKLPGMDGIKTAREIRRAVDNDAPILLISAYDWNEIEEEAREAGINGFISKPLFKSTLFYGLRAYSDQEQLQVETETATEAEPDRTEDDVAGRRILLAEDNDLNWEIAQELLTEAGLELDWAENGQVCVEKFEHSEPGWYDGILMDLRMPVMTGYEATVAIRALDRPDAAEIPIIAMTADAFAEDAKKCLDCGMNAHIAKPIDVREVIRALKRYMK